MRATDDWKRALDCGQIVATVMIDLSKAFDTINHDLLLKKLYAYGIYMEVSYQGLQTIWYTLRNKVFETHQIWCAFTVPLSTPDIVFMARLEKRVYITPYNSVLYTLMQWS